MSIEKLKLKFIGEAPLVQHSGRLANPLDPATKALKVATGKRNKTDADFEEVARLEFMGSLYLDESMNVVLPSYLVEAALIEGARKSKQGKQAQAGMYVEAHARLDYGKPLTPKELWEAAETHRLHVGVRVGQARVMRTRPIFPEWQAEVEVSYDNQVMNREAILQIAEVAGHQVGFGDWRPRYGRFTVSEV